MSDVITPSLDERPTGKEFFRKEVIFYFIAVALAWTLTIFVNVHAKITGIPIQTSPKPGDHESN
ncbi:hypothetical protein [Candidatus Regiella insecticola]|uniref:hypothetical protein n=1 Tax=Candidatus Regiella insecticola TaxID=138073 RepID=UPI0005C604D7|nr:hypothetical protein [Candidatus Regiella insecticola]